MRIAGDFAAPQILQKMFTVINKYCKMFKVKIDNKIKFTTQNTRANAGKSLAAGAPLQTPLGGADAPPDPLVEFERFTSFLLQILALLLLQYLREAPLPSNVSLSRSIQNVPSPLYLRHRCNVVCSLV